LYDGALGNAQLFGNVRRRPAVRFLTVAVCFVKAPEVGNRRRYRRMRRG